MAKNDKRQTKSSYTPMPFYGFIPYNLDETEKKFLKEQGVDHERLWDTAESLIENGYSFKFGWDSYNQAFQCVIAARHADHKDAGYLLTGRGSTCAKALRQALYIGEQINWSLADFYKTHQQPKDTIDD